MFQNMLKSATFPVIWEALNAIDNELDGVQKRLKKITAKSTKGLSHRAKLKFRRRRLKLQGESIPTYDFNGVYE